MPASDPWYVSYNFAFQTPQIQALFAQDPGDVAMQVLVLLVGTMSMQNQNDTVRLQLLEMDKKNKQLALLNKTLGDLQSYKAKFPADTKPDKSVLPLPQEVIDDLNALQQDPNSIKTYGDLLGAIEKVRASIDQLNSLSQQDATRLQMGVNQSQVYSDMTTNSMQTFFNSLKAIVRNLV
ncbi:MULTISPECIES: hypothetical protein [Candidatus Ichthyocystis]|uniref:Putative membrane protein n=1 Tax=Candidatus Ichthyocystis hellenicum TaxID=1561003 RepID=A0A0S4LZS9_9BURK|nr:MULTISPECIES: hypothetical protein [Ichthyocystis]CUT17081.1 putative membrane protein [Candidatus Ichthyocystis hellenicum]